MRILAPALFLLPLNACMVTPAPDTASDRTCANEGLDAFKGQIADADLGARMLAQTGAKTIRWVQPGMMVTMDYSPQRLTVHLTADNRVDHASCG